MSLETRIEFIDEVFSPFKEDEDLSYCLHDMLSDDADWNDDYWKFELGDMENFIDKIKLYYQKSRKGIKFSAIFSPDLPEHTCHITIEELEYKLSNNLIGIKTVYLISKN